MESRERRILYIYGICAFCMALLGPPLWWLASQTIHLVPTWIVQNKVLSVILRADAILMYIMLGIAAGLALILLGYKDLMGILTVLIMVLYSATLFGDACVAMISRFWDLSAIHEVQFFGFHLSVDLYIYISIMASAVCLSFVNIRWWWQILATMPYLWNVWLANPLVYIPLRKVLPVYIYGMPESLIAILINVAFTAFIIIMIFYVKKKEEEPVKEFKNKRIWSLFKE